MTVVLVKLIRFKRELVLLCQSLQPYQHLSNQDHVGLLAIPSVVSLLFIHTCAVTSNQFTTEKIPTSSMTPLHMMETQQYYNNNDMPLLSSFLFSSTLSPDDLSLLGGKS